MNWRFLHADGSGDGEESGGSGECGHERLLARERDRWVHEEYGGRGAGESPPSYLLNGGEGGAGGVEAPHDPHSGRGEVGTRTFPPCRNLCRCHLHHFVGGVVAEHGVVRELPVKGTPHNLVGHLAVPTECGGEVGENGSDVGVEVGHGKLREGVKV